MISPRSMVICCRAPRSIPRRSRRCRARRPTRRTSRRRGARPVRARSRAGAGRRSRRCRRCRARRTCPGARGRGAAGAALGARVGPAVRACSSSPSAGGCAARLLRSLVRAAALGRRLRATGGLGALLGRARGVLVVTLLALISPSPAARISFGAPSSVSRSCRLPFGELDRRRDQLRLVTGLRERRGPLGAQRLVHDLGVDLEDRVHQHLGPRRAAGQVHVDGHDVVDALHDRVVVEHAAGAGAHAHREHPARLGHLVVDLAQHRGHLVAHPAGHDHQVGLPG